MSNYDLSVTPNEVTVGLISNTAVASSWATAIAQTTARPGLRWRLSYLFRNMQGADRAELLGLLGQIRGQDHRLRVPMYDNPKRGAYGGTPLVDGASQTGSTLDIKGCSLTVTNWIRRGDYFSVIVNGEPELKVCTADASSDGSGNITGLAFEPKLRASPADGAAIYVEDGTLTVPSGIFIMDSNNVSWRSVPHRGGARSELTLDMVEDVFATQA